ncbi:MAG TPA: FecR domain-containing protein [Steroidobacter sp.]
MESRARGKFNAQIYEEACDWFGECRSGELDAAARRDFDRWLRQSPDHIAAYLEVAALYQEGGAAIPASDVDVEALIAAAVQHHDNVVDLSPKAGVREPIVPSASQPKPRRRIAIAASLATAAAVLVVVSLMFWPQTYATGIGEQRSIVLTDGSTVELNSRSKIRLRYSDEQRAVELIEGQALFKVAKDHARPFVVDSDGTLVRAVGTQFDVYRKREGTIVTVVEGRVAVLTEGGSAALAEPDTNALGPGLLVSAGEQVTVKESSAQRAAHPNIDSATAWRQRELVFDTASLFEVAEEFNRYNTRRLVIDKDERYDFHISGVFSSTDPSSLIRFLQARRDLRVIETETEIRVGKNN